MDLSKLPFSAYRTVGDTIYLSGELGFTEDMELADGIAAQTDHALLRIERTLATLGLDRSAIVSATCYLADLDEMAEFNAAYGAFFSAPLPVRTTVRADLALGAKVEISVIAAR